MCLCEVSGNVTWRIFFALPILPSPNTVGRQTDQGECKAAAILSAPAKVVHSEKSCGKLLQALMLKAASITLECPTLLTNRAPPGFFTTSMSMPSPAGSWRGSRVRSRPAQPPPPREPCPSHRSTQQQCSSPQHEKPHGPHFARSWQALGLSPPREGCLRCKNKRQVIRVDRAPIVVGTSAAIAFCDSTLCKRLRRKRTAACLCL
jgi:hypothetical protein